MNKTAFFSLSIMLAFLFLMPTFCASDAATAQSSSRTENFLSQASELLGTDISLDRIKSSVSRFFDRLRGWLQRAKRELQRVERRIRSATEDQSSSRSSSSEREEHSSSPFSVATGPSTDNRSSSGSRSSRDEIDLSQVRWLHADVSGWPVASTLRSVSISGRFINLDYCAAGRWPISRYEGGDVDVVGNPWVFVNKNGQWYAATWEWLRPGQTSKHASAVECGHIKRRELNNWRPRSGERLGFMVSGMARSGVRNIKERTNVVMFTWP